MFKIDQFGRLIHLEKHRSRLRVIENEFQRAEQLQQRYIKEEVNTRQLIQKYRFRDIDNDRLLESVERRKERERTQLELARVEREVLGHAHLYYNDKNSAHEKSNKSSDGKGLIRSASDKYANGNRQGSLRKIASFNR